MKLAITIELEDDNYQDPAGYLGIIVGNLADAAYWLDETGGDVTDAEGRPVGTWSVTP